MDFLRVLLHVLGFQNSFLDQFFCLAAVFLIKMYCAGSTATLMSVDTDCSSFSSYESTSVLLCDFKNKACIGVTHCLIWGGLTAFLSQNKNEDLLRT